MPEGSQPGLNWTTDQGMLHAPVWALRMWSPLLSEACRWNAQAREGFGTIASEWQAFVGSRLREDFALMQRVVHSRTPDQIWGAFTEFWQKAVGDYGKEYAIMLRLVAGVASKSVAAATSPAEEVSAHTVRSSGID
jgi:Phasin protein